MCGGGIGDWHATVALSHDGVRGICLILKVATSDGVPDERLGLRLLVKELLDGVDDHRDFILEATTEDSEIHQVKLTYQVACLCDGLLTTSLG